jgi:hypothetical protein
VIAVALVFAVLVGAVLGALGGRVLIRRELHELKMVAGNAVLATQRANIASARIDEIASYWPATAEAVDGLRGARAAVEDAVRRVDELEHRLAANFGIELTKARS